MACKLKALKGDLKKWNVEVFGDVGKRKKELEEELGVLDRIVENRELTVEQIIKRDGVLITWRGLFFKKR
jgi:hypothetical protein